MYMFTFSIVTYGFDPTPVPMNREGDRHRQIDTHARTYDPGNKRDVTTDREDEYIY